MGEVKRALRRVIRRDVTQAVAFRRRGGVPFRNEKPVESLEFRASVRTVSHTGRRPVRWDVEVIVGGHTNLLMYSESYSFSSGPLRYRGDAADSAAAAQVIREVQDVAREAHTAALALGEPMRWQEVAS